MNKFVDEWQAQRKFNTLLLAIFAGLALVLAMLGIYGVLSNLVASRTREIGIRMAIGASARDIGKLVLWQSMIPVSIGLAVVPGSSARPVNVDAGDIRDPIDFARGFVSPATPRNAGRVHGGAARRVSI